MEATDAVVKISTYFISAASLTLTVIIGIKEWNKRKIEEAKEKSVGAEALRLLEEKRKQDREELEEKIDSERNEHQEFRSQVFQIMFQGKGFTPWK